MDEKIKRINELYHLSRERDLTEEEKKEQATLRWDYINSIKRNLSSQLESITIKEPDGTLRKVTKNKG
ncbi:MAG: DUF896 domain-containing protein [Lachnospiraceae bacterium]|nr:DUF896 domain-containing protein [Lachnospiraceae bacterium]